MSTQRAVRETMKRRRVQTRWRDKWGRLRVRCSWITERHYEAVRVRMSRSVIGEPYDHARMTEALLTRRYREPIVVPLDRLLPRLEYAARRNHSEDVLWAALRSLAKWWTREREPVRHPKWRG